MWRRTFSSQAIQVWLFWGSRTGSIGGRGWIFLGAAVIAFEVMTVLVLRAHYTMDVFTGAVAARYASLIAVRLSPACDRWLGRMAGEETSEQEFVATENAMKEGNEIQKGN